nr:hypothetical protein CFP56_20598 [Quercus suber]
MWRSVKVIRHLYERTRSGVLIHDIPLPSYCVDIIESMDYNNIAALHLVHRHHGPMTDLHEHYGTSHTTFSVCDVSSFGIVAQSVVPITGGKLGLVPAES